MVNEFLQIYIKEIDFLVVFFIGSVLEVFLSHKQESIDQKNEGKSVKTWSLEQNASLWLAGRKTYKEYKSGIENVQ